MRHDTPFAIRFLFHFHIPVALSFLLYATGTAAGNYPPHVAVATVIREEADVLPARVALRSAAHHAPALPRVAYSLPGAISPGSARQLEKDGVEVASFAGDNGVAGWDGRLTYTRFFGEDRFDRVLYVAPEMLIREDLGRLLDCPVFCAAFVSPCSFSVNLLAITPNKKLYGEVLRRLPSTACVGKNKPDGLGDEACALNELFGKELMDAPLFDMKEGGPMSSDSAMAVSGSGLLLPGGEKTAMRRLPMGCHTPHILYYPRLRFEVPRESCGVMRVIDFGSPSFLHPWRWWTYAIMNLSWDWHRYRLQLGDSNPPGSVTRTGVWFRVFALHVFLITALVSFTPRDPATASHYAPLPFGTFARPAEPLAIAAGLKHNGVFQEHTFLVVAAASGLVAWLLSIVVAFSWTPSTLTPYYAFALFGTYKTVILCGLLMCHGRLFCATQALPGDVGDAPPPSSARVVAETFLYSYADVFAILASVIGLNCVPAGTIYVKLICIVPFVVVYSYGMLAGILRVSMMWLAWGAAVVAFNPKAPARVGDPTLSRAD